MSPTSTHDLVSFDDPPIAEVALSVQFEPQTIDLATLGLFAHKVRHELPQQQPQPVAPPILETFDSVPVQQSIEIRLEGSASLPRIWFVSRSGIELVQLQHDRLTLNWRQVDRGGDYPRYSALRKRFMELLGTLMDCLSESGRTAVANLCEVTYVNPVVLGDSAGHHPDLARIINRLQPKPDDAFLPHAEDAQLHARWRIPASELGGDDAPIGRLHLAALPGFRPPENTPIYMLTLTARLNLVDGKPAAAIAALDTGHRWVVLGFKDLTTAEMHDLWGLREERDGE